MKPAERARREALFRDPPAAFRSLPFWAWNARLENAEIAGADDPFAEAGDSTLLGLLFTGLLIAALVAVVVGGTNWLGRRELPALEADDVPERGGLP